MEDSEKKVLFEVTGPDSERIYDAIQNVERALHEVKTQYDFLCGELSRFALHINQRDAE